MIYRVRASFFWGNTLFHPCRCLHEFSHPFRVGKSEPYTVPCFVAGMLEAFIKTCFGWWIRHPQQKNPVFFLLQEGTLLPHLRNSAKPRGEFTLLFSWCQGLKPFIQGTPRSSNPSPSANKAPATQAAPTRATPGTENATRLGPRVWWRWKEMRPSPVGGW